MPKLTAGQRRQIAEFALKWNGWGDGSGYPGKKNNPACKYVGHALEYSCADGVTFVHGKTGFPLISMQPGMSEGYAYCPDGLAKGKQVKAVIPSWTVRAADVLLIDTGDGAQPGHTETVTSVEDHGNEVWIYSLGFDSGPSNVDHFKGQGGCHRHVWISVKGKGCEEILAALDADKITDWAKVNKTVVAVHAGKKVPVTKKLKPAPIVKSEKSKVIAATTAVRADKAPVEGKSRKCLRVLRAAINKSLHRKAAS